MKEPRKMLDILLINLAKLVREVGLQKVLNQLGAITVRVEEK